MGVVDDEFAPSAQSTTEQEQEEDDDQWEDCEDENDDMVQLDELLDDLVVDDAISSSSAVHSLLDRSVAAGTITIESAELEVTQSGTILQQGESTSQK